MRPVTPEVPPQPVLNAVVSPLRSGLSHSVWRRDIFCTTVSLLEEPVQAECYATAEDELLRALRIDASDPVSLRLLGDVYTHHRKRELAAELYRKAAELEANCAALGDRDTLLSCRRR